MRAPLSTRHRTTPGRASAGDGELVDDLALGREEATAKLVLRQLEEHRAVSLIEADLATGEGVPEMVRHVSTEAVHHVRETVRLDALVGVVVTGEHEIDTPLLVRPLHHHGGAVARRR